LGRRARRQGSRTGLGFFEFGRRSEARFASNARANEGLLQFRAALAPDKKKKANARRTDDPTGRDCAIAGAGRLK